MLANPTNLAATVRRRLFLPAVFCLAALLAPAAFAQNAINTATIAPPAGVTDPVGGCTGATPPVCSGNNTATDSDTIVAPQLTLAKVANPSPFTVGVAGNYTLTLTNTGTTATTAVSTIVDTIPTGLTIGTLPAGCSAAGQVVTCTVAAGQATGAGVAVSFVIPVTPQASVGGTTVANTARASGGGDATCPASGATQARCNPTINTPVNSAANVAVVKTGPATVIAGASYTYTLALTNSGQTATGTNVIVQDQLPAGAIATAATGATCTNLNTAGALLTCTVPGPIAVGATVNVQLTVTAPATAGTIVNYAATNPTGTGNPGTPPGAGCTSNATVSCSSASTTVQAPQLTMAKTHTGNFTVGSNGQYTLTVSNTGTAPTTGTITITDTLPTGLTFVSATGAGWICGAAGQVVTCTRTAAVAAGAAAPAITLTVAVGGTAAATVTNTARASGGGDTTCPAPPAAALARCSASDSTTIVNSSDLSLTKTVDVASPVVGSNVTFTVTVTNGGPSGATGVQVVDQLPAGYTFVSSTPSAGTYTAGTGVWAIGPIANGTSVTLQIVATVNAAGPYTNTAEVTAVDQPDPDSTPGDGTGDDFGSITPTPVASANLSITKSQATPNPAVPGQAVTWTITVNNAGPSAAAAVTTADAVPSTVTGLTVGGTDGASCTVIGQNVNCAFGTVANGATRTYTISGTLAASATGNLANTVSVSSTTADPTPGNNTSTSTTPVQPSADISVNKTLTTAGPYTIGQAVSFDIVVSNAGPSVAANVALTDTPTNLGALTVTGACAAFPCTIASIASGASATVTVTGTIQADGAFANSATATLPAGTTDPNPGNNTGSDGDNTTPTADVSVVKTLTTAGPYTIGQAVSFDIVVSNAGPSIATNVALADTPTNLGALTVTGACTAFPCTIASIASGASATVTVTGTIQADGAFANSATATLPAGINDPNPGNNTGSDGDNTTPTADVSVVKTLTTAGPYTIGQTVSFDIVVTNAGPSIATNVGLADTPANLGALTVTGACTAFPCTIASIASGASATVTVTGTIQADGAFANSATATLPAGTTDPNPGNNTGSDGDNTTPTADIALSKTLTTTGTIIAGQAVSYEIVVTNNGPSTATGIVVTDTPTNLAITGVSGGGCGGFPCTIATLASGGAVTITVTGTVGPTGGAFNNSASADAAQADPVPGNNSDDASATAGAQPIVAQDDTNPTPVNGTTGGAAIASVLNANGSGPDTLNGVQATLATVTITVASPVPAQLAFDPATGAVSVNPGSAAGSYTFDYQICEQANPANCATATVTVVVAAALIDAVDDDYTGTPVNGASGGTTASVLVNDTLNGAPVTVGAGGNVTLAPGASPNPGLTMNADGTITVAAGTPAGTYQYPYTICEVLNPTNCATAIATVVVGAAVIDAVDDTGTVANGTTGGVAVANVLVNDTLNGAPATLATVTITQVSTSNPNVTIDPATGAVNVAPNTPAGTYTLVYQICEQLNPTNCATATVTVTVAAAVIDAVDDDFSGTPIIGAGGGTTASVLGNDTLNGAPVTVGAGGNVTLTPGASPNPGLTMNADGTITVAAGTPAGTYQYPYTICEVLNPTNCATAIATVVVEAATIDAVDDSAQTPQNVPVTIAVLGNDTLDGAPVDPTEVTVTQVAPPANGTITINADGTITYTPNPNFSGTDTFSYQICENLNPTNCATATVTVTVPANTVTAIDDTGTTPQNTPVTTSVLGNDSSSGAPLDPRSVAVTVQPGNGTVVVNPDGTITYTPNPGFSGTDTYTYQVCDTSTPTPVCDTAVVTITVQPNTVIAVDDSGTTPQGTPVTTPVLGNDTSTGAPLDPGSVAVTVPPGNGTVVVNPDGTITYTPNPGFSGTDTYTYQVCDTSTPTPVCDTAVVTITVQPNTVTAVDDTGTTPANTPVTIPVLGNDTSSGAPLDPGSVEITQPPGNGTVTVNPDGSITYTPNPGFIGTDTFTYQVCDTSTPTPVCTTATVTVTVTGQPPVANPDADEGTGDIGQPVTIPVLDNDSDPDNNIDPGTVVIVGAPGDGRRLEVPGEGTWTVNPDGTITFTPEPGFVGNATPIQYTVTDTTGLVSNPATVNVTIVGDASLRVVKTATPRDVKVGDLVRYTVTIENVGAANVVDATLVDTPPAGFSYVDGTLSVADGDGAARLVGTYPIRVDQIDIAIDERATVVYLLRVGAGVRGGIHRNSALVQDNGATVSNTATADVQLVADPMMDESLILGTVFDDRDSDGWQDSAAMGGVRVQGGFAPDAYVAGSSTLDRGDGPQPLADASAPLLRGIDVGDIAGRQSDADSVDARRVVVSQVLSAPQFADDFVLTTRQGVTLRMDAVGNTRLERGSGDAAKGLTGAEPTVERRVSQVANGYRIDYVIGNAGVDERGIPGVRIASVEGLLVETDQFGRYHLVGIDGGSWERGRNFILKVDPATVPPGSTFTTDNPLLRRVTPGLPVRFDFGIRLPPGLVEGGTQDVEMTLGEVMFDAESAKLRSEYLPVIEKIAGEVREHRGGEVVLAAGAADQGAASQALAYERGKAVQSALLAALSPEDAANVRISLRVDPEDPSTTALSLGATPVLGTVLFDTDRAEVKPEFAALIDAIAADIGKRSGGTDMPIVIGIVGHADKRGSDAYNVALGLRRAKAVFEAIAAKLDPEVRARLRVDISEDPTAPLQTDAARGE